MELVYKYILKNRLFELNLQLTDVNDKKYIPILIGAGFSKPAGYPIGNELSRLIEEVDDNTLKSLGASLDLIRFYREFILFYKSYKMGKIISYLLSLFSIKNRITLAKYIYKINYEEFYDFYYKFKQSWVTENEEIIETFCISFLDTWKGLDKPNKYFDLIHHFDSLFQKVISYKLSVTSDIEANYSKYEGFINWIGKDKFEFAIHTLNHDLLIEKLMDKFAVTSFSDGYDQNGSDFFIEDRNKKIVLPFFNDYANNARVNLYKLHGSIDQYKIVTVNNFTNIENFAKRVKSEQLIQNFYDIKSKTGIKISNKTTSEFLTGRESKKYDYDNLVDSHFPNIINYFKHNIFNQRYLIVIGYSFCDKLINEFIENYFQIYRHSGLIIVDPYPSDNAKDLQNRYPKRIKIEPTGIENVDWENIIEKHFPPKPAIISSGRTWIY